MPLYDYRCTECKQVSEILINSVSTQTVRCPECGSQNMEKLISASYMIKMDRSVPGATCCGRSERCGSPPCSSGNTCVGG
jgi:putative FmdB family regulatory protein